MLNRFKLISSCKNKFDLYYTHFVTLILSNHFLVFESSTGTFNYEVFLLEGMENTITSKKKGKYRSFLSFNIIIVSIVLSILTGCEKDLFSPAGTVTGIDGNIYNVIKIGTQTWFGENLKTTKYNDGILIPYVDDGFQWTYLTTDAFCYSLQTYGNLYNWYAINTGKLCPTGWHIPSSDEWKVLEDYLGGSYDAGGRLKEEGTTNWDEPNYGAINSSGFSALPAGYFSVTFLSGDLSSLGGIGYFTGFWSSTEADSQTAFTRYLISDDHVMGSEIDAKFSGLSVRCLKDN
jgi:uncharacterized protein (TIGR02145 family)